MHDSNVLIAWRRRVQCGAAPRAYLCENANRARESGTAAIVRRLRLLSIRGKSLAKWLPAGCFRLRTKHLRIM